MSVEKEKWYARPVFSVNSVEESLGYYCELLGFTENWRYDENNELLVAQVSRGDFELILAGNLDRKGNGRVFISLTDSETSQFKETIKKNNIPYETIYWGYPSIQLQDPDGNEMIFPQETDG